MTDVIELHLANRVVYLTPDERDEWARRAVKVFQGMEYLWTAFARVLTGNPAMRVVMSGGSPRTDGTTIYYRPPLALGDPSPHVRNQCDRRNAAGHLICPACSSRELVERSITHEISHIVGGSFQKSSADAQQRALRQAVAYAKNPIARAHLEAGLHKVRWGSDVQTMMFMMSPFLGMTIMALEDARIDMKMFKARPGVRKMFASSQKRFSTTGMVNLDGEVVQWSTRPLNAQIMIGLLWQAEGFELGDLHDKVKQDLQDPILQDVCLRVGRSGSALEIAALTVETLTRLWELGYCDPPEDMPEPPPYEPPLPPPPAQDEPEDAQDEPDPEEQSGDDSGDQGASDDDAGDEESSSEDSGDSGTDESDSGGGSPGEGDGGTSASGSPGQPDGDEDQADESGGDDLPDSGGDESSGEPDGSQAGDAGESSSEPSDGPGDQDPDDGGGSADSGNEPEGGAGSEPVSDSDEDHEQRGDGSGDRPGHGSGDDDGLDGESDHTGDGSVGPSSGEPSPGDHPGDAGPEPADDSESGPGEDREGSAGNESVAGESADPSDAGLEPGTDSQEATDPGAGDDGSSGDDGRPESTDALAGSEDDGESSSEGDRGDDPRYDGRVSAGPDSGPDVSADSESGDWDSESESDPGGQDTPDGSGGQGSSGGSVDTGDPGSTPGDDRAGEEPGGIPVADEAGGSQDADTSLDQPAGERTHEPPAEDLPEHGAPEDVAQLIQDLTGHNHDDDDEHVPGLDGPDPGVEKAVDKAITQNQHFDAPSATVSGLQIFTWPEDDERCEAWERRRASAELTVRIGDKDREGNDLWDTLRTPEEILQPALFEMRRVLSDNRRARDERNIKRGKLDGRSLGKRAWKGDDDRLYKKRTRPKDRSYAIVIAGDCSWSQHLGKTMVVTKQAMFAQAELCHRMGIQFEVWAHTAAYSDAYKRNRESEEYDMMMHRIKSWTDPWNAKHQEGLAWLHAVETNLDGHNLEFLRKRLMQTTATDKILLYYTDGEMPAANYSDELDVFKREIELYKRLGIVLVGVGVGTDSPKRWGLPTVRIDKKGDIGKVVKHLEGEILRARR